MKRRALALVVGLFVVGAVACSPEATRTRGGGPGADIGNHSPTGLPQPSTPPPVPGG